MTRTTMLALCSLLLAASTAIAQPDPWMAKSSRLKTRSAQDSAGHVRIEYPDKDWLIVPGGASMLVTLTEKSAEASIVVEASDLHQPLAPEEVTDLFATIEVETIQQRDPKAGSFARRVIDANGRRVVVVEYTRPGARGVDRVRQYSYPIGSTLYRVICTAPQARAEKYGATFAHVAATFSVVAQ